MPPTLAADLRSAIHSIDPAIPVGAVTPVRTLIAERTARHRLASLALTLFGSLALALCACGLYAVVALSSRLRRREYAIRMALGARAGDVQWLICRQAMLIAAAGTSAGVAAAIKSPDVAQRFSAEGSTPVGSRPEQFSAHIKSEINKWRKLVKDAGLALH